MSYTKQIALSDKIEIDGNDVSDAFSAFNVDLSDEQVDVSGFNADGSDEYLQGKRASSFTGTAFYTPELHAILYPLYANRDTFEVTWQPDGLADPTREVWYGNVNLLNYPPTAERGNVRTMSLTFPAADAAGIVAAAAT